MKKFTAIFAIFAMAGIAIAQNRSIKFENKTFEELKKQAQKEGKMIFFDVATDPCGPCRVMETKVFTKDSVADFFNAHFASAKLNDEEGEGVKFVEENNIRAFPTYLFFSADGQLMDIVTGARSAEDFLNIGKNALDPEKGLNFLDKEYERGNRSPKFLKEYLKKLADAYLPYQNILEEFFKAENDPYSENSWEVIRNYTDPDSKYFKFLVENREKYKSLYGKEVDSTIKLTTLRAAEKRIQISNFLLERIMPVMVAFIAILVGIFIGIRKLIRFAKKR